MDFTLTLPGGETITGTAPVVVVGPNGSGKTRQTRQIAANVPIEFINALRNTRVATDLPAMGMETARNNFQSQRNQSRTNHWDLSSDFDYMLSQLLAQQSMSAIEFARRYREDRSSAGEPGETPLTHVETLWSEVFPGRELHWRDWKPLIRNKSAGAEVEYSGNQMSDGEKAVLYLAGRVFSTESGVCVVDEPETHLHSLLAVRLWNALENARQDIRFVYVTHDLTFAMSRQSATYVLASPLSGLRKLDLTASLPDDVAEALLGSASLSFYASRVVFCEGDIGSLDALLYNAWFNGPDTVVRPVGSCQRVIRCVDAASHSGIAAALTAVGLIDTDYHPVAYCEGLPADVRTLAIHEIESLLALPALVEAVCAHTSAKYVRARYHDDLRATISANQARQVIVERWKQRMEPHLEGLVSGVKKRQASVADLVGDLPNIFDHTMWEFSPEQFLLEEQTLIETALTSGSSDELLRLMPGKQMVPVAARHCGLTTDAYIKLIVSALNGEAHRETPLPEALASALAPYLPDRHVAIKGLPIELPDDKRRPPSHSGPGPLPAVEVGMHSA